MTSNSSDLAIPEMSQAEGEFLAALEAETGLKFPRLAMARTATPAALRSRVLRFVVERIADEKNARIRCELFPLFAWQQGSAYLNKILDWHSAEREEFSIQDLEHAILSAARGQSTAVAIDHLVRFAPKLRLNGLLFLLAAAEKSDSLLLRLREGFAGRRFDLEVLSVFANQYERQYNHLAGVSEPNSCYLTGRQCMSIFQHQIPRGEYGFRRAEFVPFYAKIERLISSSDPGYLSMIQEAAVTVDMPQPGEDVIRRVVNAIEPGAAAPLGIRTLANQETIAVIALAEGAAPAPSRETGHRPRSMPATSNQAFKVAIVRAPPPDPQNLLPKNLLPSNHPLRWARPEV